MMILGQIANLVAVLALLAVDLFGISLYIYFGLSIVVASFCGQAQGKLRNGQIEREETTNMIRIDKM